MRRNDRDPCDSEAYGDDPVHRRGFPSYAEDPGTISEIFDHHPAVNFVYGFKHSTSTGGGSVRSRPLKSAKPPAKPVRWQRDQGVFRFGITSDPVNEVGVKHFQLCKGMRRGQPDDARFLRRRPYGCVWNGDVSGRWSGIKEQLIDLLSTRGPLTHVSPALQLLSALVNDKSMQSATVCLDMYLMSRVRYMLKHRYPGHDFAMCIEGRLADCVSRIASTAFGRMQCADET